MVQESQQPIVPQKRKNAKQPKPGRAHTPNPSISFIVNYAVSVFTSAEMKKAVSKWVAKCSSFQLRTDEPWDTLKAQLLVKVSNAISDDATLD